jgi:chromatin segregation and condensation protein Rec8/ScpA/Scc1 (kleisin family)
MSDNANAPPTRDDPPFEGENRQLSLGSGAMGFGIVLDSYVGPVTHLVDEVRAGRVDLKALNFGALIDQFIVWFHAGLAAGLPLSVLADGLVSVARLCDRRAYLTLPQTCDVASPTEPEPDRSADLDHARRLGAWLMARDRQDYHWFLRGRVELGKRAEHRTALADRERALLTSAYLEVRDRTHEAALQRARQTLKIRRPAVVPLDLAMAHIREHVGPTSGFEALVPQAPERLARAARAAIFASLLEMTREGEVTLHQHDALGPLKVDSTPLLRVPPAPLRRSG